MRYRTEIRKILECMPRVRLQFPLGHQLSPFDRVEVDIS
jgi:hypothetical protein